MLLQAFLCFVPLCCIAALHEFHAKKARKMKIHVYMNTLPDSLTSKFATAEVMKSFLYLASIFQIPYLQYQQSLFFKMKIIIKSENINN